MPVAAPRAAPAPLPATVVGSITVVVPPSRSRLVLDRHWV